MGKYWIVMLTLLLAVTMSMQNANADMLSKNFTDSSKGIPYKDAQFFVTELKYDPYPVNAGEWFDVWVKAQNIGQEDAPNASFRLLKEYPFSDSEDDFQSFGLISGKINAFKNTKSDERTPQENQVVMKFRVNVADSAADGEHQLKIAVSPDGNQNSSRLFYLPIYIAKTKTDFDVQLQGSTSKKVIFQVADIGDKIAKAVSVRVVDGPVIGQTIVSIGDLNPGEFTSVSFEIEPNKTVNFFKIELSYTDTGGIRNIVQKQLPVRLIERTDTTAPAAKTEIKFMPWAYGAAGLLLGGMLTLLVARKRR